MRPKRNHHVPRSSPVHDRERLQDFLHQLLSLEPDEKRLVLYKLLCDLLGKRPTREVGIYDPTGWIYGYFLPPEVRFELQLLEDPEFAKEMDRRSRATGSQVPLNDFLKSLKADSP
jgi:hypothetical protein